MASTTVKIFHSELPNAPVLSGTAGSRVAILDACLVTGWGLLTASSASVSGGVCTLNFSSTHSFEVRTVALISGAAVAAINGEQRITSTGATSIAFPVSGVPDGPVSGTITAKIAPAGWVKYAGANKAAYKSSNPSASGCWARIDDTAAKYARIRAYETMTDVDTGVGPTPLDLQLSGGGYIIGSNSADGTSRKWVVVASDKAVYFMTAYYSSYANDYQPHFFGDFASLKAGDAYNFLVACDVADNSGQNYVATGSTLVQSEGSVGCFAVRGYTQAGGSQPITMRKPGLKASSGWSSLPPGPNPINNSLELCPSLLFEGMGDSAPRRGVLPGFYGIPHYCGLAFDSKTTLSAVEGLPGHAVMFFRYLTASIGSGARYAIDITGPWE